MFFASFASVPGVNSVFALGTEDVVFFRMKFKMVQTLTQSHAGLQSIRDSPTRAPTR